MLSLCEFPVSSSLSCLDAAVYFLSPFVDVCIQGNGFLVFNQSVLVLVLPHLKSSTKLLDRQRLVVQLRRSFF